MSFLLPTMLGFVFQQFYNIADSAIVGRTLGAEKLAAVGCTWSLGFLVLGFCMGCCSGFAIPLAQCFGAKDEKALRAYLYNAVRICAVISVSLSVITTLLSPCLLRLMQTPEDIMQDAQSYIIIIYLGIPATMLYNMCCCVLRSLGDSKTPVIFLVAASLINVVLDFLMILSFHMGIIGAAVATVTSQLFSGIGCLIVLIRKFPILRGSQDEKKLQWKLITRLINIGVPMGLQFSITAIGGIVLQVAINGLGTLAVSALSAGNRVAGIFTCTYDALASTVTTYTGQNIGAGRPDRVSEGVRSSSLLGIMYSLIVAAVLWIFGQPMVSMFVDVNQSPQVVEMGAYLLRVDSCFYIPLMFVNVLRLAIQGMGYTREAMLAGLLETAARILVAVVLVPWLGYTGVCLAHPAAWVLACLFLFPCYFAKIGKERKRFGCL